MIIFVVIKTKSKCYLISINFIIIKRSFFCAEYIRLLGTHPIPPKDGHQKHQQKSRFHIPCILFRDSLIGGEKCVDVYIQKERGSSTVTRPTI